MYTRCYDGSVTDTNKWMTIKEAVEHLGISRAALDRAAKAGKIEKAMIMNTPAFRRTDVMKYKPREYPRKGKDVVTDEV